MPFPWLHPDIPADYRATYPGKSLESLRTEVRQRATLLMHLGYTQAETKARCRDNLRWDFDLSGSCPIEAEVNKLVSEVYRRSHK